ncbi:MAG: FecR domain-containing protein [Pseudomonadota bacterium]
MTPEQKRERDDILRVACDWLVHIESAQVSATERRAFKRWYDADPRHRDMYDYANTFYQALGKVSADALEGDITVPKPPTQSISLTPWIERLTRSFRPEGIRAQTAVLALGVMLFVGFMFTPLITDVGSVVSAPHQTSIGETRVLTLDDGTRLTLGAASSVQTRFSPGERRLRLISGAVFLEVAKEADRPFHVSAGNLDVQVHGTEFDVNLQDDGVRVAVAEGVVEVSYPFTVFDLALPLGARRELSQGQQIAATPAAGLLDVQNINLSAVGAWRQGRLSYNGARLSELVADANRYTDQRVIIAGDVDRISNFSVRGSFDARDIDTILETLVEVYPVRVDRDEAGTIRIVDR